MKKLALILAVPALCVAVPASAHFNLQSPTPNTTSTDGGMGSPPCGVGTASNVVTPVMGGRTIMLKIDEFVAHTGFYRVALALDSLSELPLDNVVKDSKGNILPPSGTPNGISASAAFENPPVFPVLQDNLFPHQANGEQIFQLDLTVPNVTCEKCTLQVIEFMQDHPFNTASPPDTGPGGGYFYHHCADLKITADPSLPAFGSGGASGTGSAGASGVSGAASSTGGAGVSAAAGTGGATSSGTAGQSNAAAGANVGGSTSSGGSGVTSGAGATTASSPSSDSGGCSYVAANRNGSRGLLALLAAAGAFALVRRRRAH